MKYFVSIAFILIILKTTFAQTDPVSITWYSLEEAMELNKEKPKLIFIDVYTDWCGYCKKMDATTFASSGIAAYLNRYFYSVKFDAESLDTIKYQDTIYTPSENRKTHELAIKLLEGKLSYPSFVIIDKDTTKSVLGGYLEVNALEPILIYFANNLNKYTPFNDFKNSFMFTYPQVYKDKIAKLKEIEKLDTSGTINWITFEKATELAQKNPKKLFIDLYTDWSTVCNIMNKTTYRNKEVADYINEKFYSVRFNAASKDTITAFDKLYINEQKEHPFHQLAIALLNGQMSFPATIYMTGDQNPIVIKEFLTFETIMPLLIFLGDEKYKTQSWIEFRKEFKIDKSEE